MVYAAFCWMIKGIAVIMIWIKLMCAGCSKNCLAFRSIVNLEQTLHVRKNVCEVK